MPTPYELLGGEEGVRNLCNAFYDAMNTLPEATAIRQMHAGDLAPIKQKLYEYLSGWLGGPALYLEKHGTVCMTGPHKPFAIGPRERDQWLLCMDTALRQINASDEVKAMLQEPLKNIADMIRNRESN